MKFSELQKNTDPIHYIVYTLFAETVYDEDNELAKKIEVSINRVNDRRYPIYYVSVHDTDDASYYSIHTNFTIYLGDYSALVDIEADETTGDPLYAIFQYKNPIPFHVEYIDK